MTSLQKWNKNTVLVLNNEELTITKCLTDPHISVLISEYGFKAIAERIIIELKKINLLYGFKTDESYYPLFVEFIIQTYKFESMADIIMCLTNGRNGKYGKPFKQLDPATFQKDWMSQHLEQKAIARESKNDKNKHDFKDKTEYTKTVLQGIENLKEIAKSKKKTTDKEAEYQKFKAEYEAKSKTI